MTPKPSLWWPTSADPNRWFDEVDMGPRRRRSPGLGHRGRWPSDRPPATGPDDLDAREDAAIAAVCQLMNSHGGSQTRLEVDPSVSDTNARLISNRRLAVSAGLLRQPAPIRDWMIVHELAHLKSGHLRRAGLVEGAARSMLVLLLILIGVSFRGIVALPFAGLGAIGIVGLALGVPFYRRHLEREADWEASQMVQRPDIRDLLALYVMGSARLDPPLVSRLLSFHPAPADRLEFLSRL